MPQVTDEDREILEQPISLQEVEIAIKQLELNKCPGLDGLPIDFYQHLEEKIKHTIHALILKWVENKKMSPTARQGVISLLEKSCKDQLLIKNWRPLSLLCSDYKIYAKILANRLNLVSSYIFHPDQSGFLKSRFIAENLMDLNTV